MGERNDSESLLETGASPEQRKEPRPASVTRKWRVTLPSAIAISVAIVLALSVLLFKATGMRIVLPMDKSLGNRAFVCTERKPDTVSQGDLVEFLFPVDTPYYKKGQPFLKMVGCAEGQELTVESGKNYYCDGRHIGTARDTDSKGNPVVNFEYRGRVPKGKLFVIGTNPKSYDSRYWGFLEVSEVTGKCYAITP